MISVQEYGKGKLEMIYEEKQQRRVFVNWSIKCGLKSPPILKVPHKPPKKKLKQIKENIRYRQQVVNKVFAFMNLSKFWCGFKKKL